MTTVINFYGGPGCGKSTMAAQLFGEMKSRTINVEYVPEFAKELTWKQSDCLDDQLYLLGEQHHRIYTLFGKTDYIITDSPLLLTLHYLKNSFSKFKDNKELLDQLHVSMTMATLFLYKFYNNINFNIVRNPNKKFLQKGRNQTLKQSIAIDNDINMLLTQYNIPFKSVKTFDQVLQHLKL